VPTVLGNFLSH